MTPADGSRLYEEAKASALTFARDTFAKLRRGGNGNGNGKNGTDGHDGHT